MKVKKLIKILTVILITLSIIFTLMYFMIDKYLKEYNIEDVTPLDVIAIDMGLDSYEELPSRKGGNFVLATGYWNGEGYFDEGVGFVDRRGTAIEYVTESGDTAEIIGTDDWCKFFRVYQIIRYS